MCSSAPCIVIRAPALPASVTDWPLAPCVNVGRLSPTTVWETEADLDASESKLAGPRAEAAKAAGAGPLDVHVELFETPVIEISAAVPQTAARTY